MTDKSPAEFQPVELPCRCNTWPRLPSWLGLSGS